MRELAPCGTRAAYIRHRRRGEEPCAQCRAAATVVERERRGGSPRKAAQCGTKSGYAAHRRREEPPCASCTEANRIASRKSYNSRPRPRAECGTNAGWRAHQRRKEPPCTDCQAAHATHLATPKLPPRQTDQCGTRAGYEGHRRRRERPCEPCVQANRKYGLAIDAARRAKKRDAPEEPIELPPVITQINRNWRADAACLDIPDPEIFYPGTSIRSPVDEALEICGWCPVRSECLEDALNDPSWQDLGVRGGLTEQQRRSLRRRRDRAS